ncbi:MAG: 30S ribosomal protein S20 [Rhodospirillales bacterium]|nr:30S ribosomal protein S20 [Rhodospirillales bacterium]
MAYYASAKRKIREIALKTPVNQKRMSRIRTSLRKVEDAITTGTKEKAQAAFREMQPVLMAGGNKGMVHARMVSRKLSRLSARIKKMATSA